MLTGVVARYRKSHCLSVLFPCKYRFSLKANYKVLKEKNFSYKNSGVRAFLTWYSKCCIEIEMILHIIGAVYILLVHACVHV